MVANRGVGVRQLSTNGTTPKEHRLTIAGMVAENAPGTPRSGLLNPASTNIVFPKANMSYDVLACAAVIYRDQDEGVYTPTLTGVTNIPTGNAPSSGSRWDIVWIKQNDPEKQDNDGNTPPASLNTAMVRVTQGQAAASPVKPAIPAGAYALSEHQIFSGTTATNASPNTSRQLWRYTAFRGVPIPVRGPAEKAEIAPFNGLQIQRLDFDGLPIETYSSASSSWASTFNLPQGVKVRRIQTSISGAIGSVQVIDNIPSFTFKAGRQYRIIWDANFYGSGANSTFAFSIGSCSTSDPASQTSGITNLRNTADRPNVGQEGRNSLVTAYYPKDTNITTQDVTLQIKASAQRVNGGDALYMSGSDGNPNTLLIEDIGALTV